MPTMKALTLWQPWATLIALGAKQYETRSWSTEYRGLLAIHAARRPIMIRELNEQIFDTLEQHEQVIEHLPLGAVVAIVRLVDIVPVEQVTALATTDPRIRDEELRFGNFSAGRYAWKLELERLAPEPIPTKGAQRPWDWDYE